MPAFLILAIRDKSAEPALNTPALVIKTPRTLVRVFRTGSESINIEVPHIFSDPVEVLDEFAVSHENLCLFQSVFFELLNIYIFYHDMAVFAPFLTGLYLQAS